MILTCPSCDTRFRIDDAAFVDADGRPRARELRCAKCSHTWRHAPGPVPEPETAAPTIGAPSVEPVAAEPYIAPVADPAVPPPHVDSPLGERVSPSITQPRRSWVGVGCLILIVLIAAAVAAGVLARDQIAAAWPPAVSFYQFVGISLAPSGAGLQIGKVSPTRTADALIIEGDITNISGVSRVLPKLRIALRDPSGKELAAKTIDPPVVQLAPGAIAHYKTPFERPDDAATDIAVTFALKAE
jgi:predicted Zn finger-like uncharacterized protein